MSAAVSAVSAVALAVLAVACALGAGSGVALVDSFARVLADPWGRVFVVDLNVGFVAFLVVVWLFEPRRSVALATTVLTPVLGNFVPLAWLLARGALLSRAAARSDAR
jgi:hypothetical protein